jgi:hypothetical protein
MSLQNLKEDQLYSLLPEGILSLDEQKLIQSVVGGFQDRVDDLRAYTSKLELLLIGQGLPETDSLGQAVPNAVIAVVQSPSGKVYNRSLEIHDDTPASGSADLLTWVEAQLQLDEEHVLISAAYGVDRLRLVETSVLPSLAATVGAVLYQTAAQDPANADSDARRLLSTWFPRLQFKGTAESFETLGRLLGFDDARMTPLWSRLSPRVPNDVGSPENNPDYAVLPEFYPKQIRDNFYDPLVLTDGPYFTWTGTATTRLGTNSTEFYSQVCNGFNPYFKVVQVGTNPRDPVSADSPYFFQGGGAEFKAAVSPAGSGLRFEAVANGSSFNGMALFFQDWNEGTHRLISVTERLSAIKYRSSHFDLALTVDFDRSENLFGTHVVAANANLAADPDSANFGTTALSPYRPWTGGSVAQDLVVRDWVSEVMANGNQTVVSARVQASLMDRQLDHNSLSAAGVQVVQAMEEVRPATRHPRTVGVGYLMRDQVGYADYVAFGTLFTAAPGVGTYWGTLNGYPYPPYQVEFELEQSFGGTVAVSEMLAAEGDVLNADHLRVASAALDFRGTYDYHNSTWMMVFPGGYDPASTLRVYTHYQPTSTEVVREQPPVWADPVTIAVSGDGGLHNAAQLAVNNMVSGWNPDAYFYTGDNSYYVGLPGEVYTNFLYARPFIDAKKLFVCAGNHDFYNPDSPVGYEPVQSGEIRDYGQNYQVKPTTPGAHYVVYNGGTYLGNQEFIGVRGVTEFLAYNGAIVRRRSRENNGWDLSIETNYLDYLPGNGRYYHVRVGHVELFVVNDGVNLVEDPGFRDQNKPAEPDGNWCEAPYAPVGAGVKSPAAGNPILVSPGMTYTVHASESYGDLGERWRPNYVVYQSGTYRDNQSFTAGLGTTHALIYGEPRLDPAPKWVVLRQARRYRVIANPGSHYVTYSGTNYYGGSVIQSSFDSDMNVATTTGTVRLDRLNSAQAAQVKDWLARSTAPWKVVMYHHPNEHTDQFNSGHKSGLYPRTDWPWQEWGADILLHGHVHSYARMLRNGVTEIIIGIGGAGNKTFNTGPGAYQSPYVQFQYNYSPVSEAAAPTNWGAMLWTVTPTRLYAEARILGNGLIEAWELAKPEPVRAYQARPEDELEGELMDLSDEYAWRRDLVLGGELVDHTTYYPPTPDLQTVNLGQTVAVFSQTGAQYDVTLSKPGAEPPRFQWQERLLSDYTPGQMAIAFSGTFLSLPVVDPRQESVLPRRTLDQEAVSGGLYARNLGVDHNADDLDWSMQPGWRLYHFGLVQGVLVADPVKFFGPHHRDGLVAWYPLNEHPREALMLADHSAVGEQTAVPALDPEDRQYDPQRGWYLRLAANRAVSTVKSRSISSAVSLGFWIRPTQTAAPECLLRLGPLSLYLGLMALRVYVEQAGVATDIVGAGLSPGWNYVAITGDAARRVWNIYRGYPATALTLANTVTEQADAWGESVTLSLFGMSVGCDLQDVRIWNTEKTLAGLELARYHAPQSTAVLYRPAYLQAVNDYDRYGVRVLESGWVTPERLPSTLETPAQAWVLRYASTGEYQAQSRYRETGLGSGNTPPVKQYLGLQWNTMTGAGTTAVSTWKGGFMGVNGAWDFDNPPPLAMQLLQSGSTRYGILPTWINTGTSAPWPNPLQATNPCRDRIWIEGDDRYLYEVTVARSGTGTVQLQAERLLQVRADGSLVPTYTEQPTGAQVALTSVVHGNQLSVSTLGQVYAAPYAGTVTSAPLYLYGSEEVNVDLSGAHAFNAWVEKNSYGIERGAAIIQDNGQIAFELVQGMPAGYYRLEVTSGNVGQADEDFDGFRVLITLGDYAFEGRLCQGQRGADFTATDTFEFLLPRSLPGAPSSWLLTFGWLNALRDERHGTARRLKISAVKAVRLYTRLYELDLAAGGTSLVEWSTSGTAFPVTPGGWLVTITSWGTALAPVHEATVYSSNDTVQSRQPLAHVLTATTVERREDVILNGSFVIPDLPIPALPAYGAITIT